MSLQGAFSVWSKGLKFAIPKYGFQPEPHIFLDLQITKTCLIFPGKFGGYDDIRDWSKYAFGKLFVENNCCFLSFHLFKIMNEFFLN